MRFSTIALSAIGTLASSAAYAGGYVVPIIEAVPQVVATGNSPSPWLAAIPLALLLLLSRDGGDRATLPPGDHGGPCFREDTLILMADAKWPGVQLAVSGIIMANDYFPKWKRVDELEAGDIIVTTKGPQVVLNVASWTPTEFSDRPVLYMGVQLSKNHCVMRDDAEQRKVPAIFASSERTAIDGSAYYHVLTAEHAWCFVKGNGDGPTVIAETMFLTKDMKPLCDEYPTLIEQHATHPCDEFPIWVSAETNDRELA